MPSVVASSRSDSMAASTFVAIARFERGVGGHVGVRVCHLAQIGRAGQPLPRDVDLVHDNIGKPCLLELLREPQRIGQCNETL